jgi:sulfatase maturation enzyme AslB (radical SAM superfamily)
MGERRGDGMTAFKTVMNNYQSFLQTNTKTESNWRSEDINLSFVMIIFHFFNIQNIIFNKFLIDYETWNKNNKV